MQPLPITEISSMNQEVLLDQLVTMLAIALKENDTSPTISIHYTAHAEHTEDHPANWLRVLAM